MQSFALRIATGLALVLTSSAGRPAEPAPLPRPAGVDPLPAHAVARLGTARWRAEGSVTRAALLPGGREVVAVAFASDCPAQVFDAATGQAVRRVGAGGTPPADAPRTNYLSPDGRLLAQEHPAGTSRLTVWDVADGRRLWASPPGRVVLFRGWGGAGDGTLLTEEAANGGWWVGVRDARTGAERCRLAADKNRRSVRDHPALSADGRWVATAFGNGAVWLWDAATGARAHELRKPSNKNAEELRGCEVAFHSAGGAVVAWADVRVVKGGQPVERKVLTAWDVRTGTERYSQEFDEGWRMTFAPDGSAAVVRSFKEGRLFDLATGREREWLGRVVKDSVKAGRGVKSLNFSPDGTRVVINEWGKDAAFTVAARDARTGELAWSRTLATLVNDVAYSADGTVLLVVTNCSGGGSILALWDAATGKDLGSAPPPGHRWPVTDVAFAAGGGSVATLSREEAWSWDAAGRLLRTTTGPPGCRDTALSPDARLLACDTGTRCVVLRTDGGPSRKPFPTPVVNGQVEVEFSHDGESLHFSGWDGGGRRSTPSRARSDGSFRPTSRRACGPEASRALMPHSKPSFQPTAGRGGSDGCPAVTGTGTPCRPWCY